MKASTTLRIVTETLHLPGVAIAGLRHPALDGAGLGLQIPGCQSAGRPLRAPARGGKSGLHGMTVPDNVRRGRPQGQCHRKQTAPGSGVRVKGCGKSAPRTR
jgi:hypothetical protein